MPIDIGGRGGQRPERAPTASATRRAQYKRVVVAVVLASVAVGNVAGGQTREPRIAMQGGDAALRDTTPSRLSHEPRDMRAITRNDFRQLEEDGWRAHYAGLSIVTDAEAPRSAPYVAELRYPRGFVGGESPGLLERGLDGSPTTLYLSFWLKLSQNWVGHPTGTNKVLHLWLGDRNRVFVYADGAGSGILRAAIGVQGIVSNGGSANLLPNLSTAEVVRGRWHHWEIVVRANHTQRSDGEITWWLDGRPAGRYSGVAFTMRGEGFELMKWDPTWGGLGGRLGASQAMWMDEIFASGR